MTLLAHAWGRLRSSLLCSFGCTDRQSALNRLTKRSQLGQADEADRGQMLSTSNLRQAEPLDLPQVLTPQVTLKEWQAIHAE